jgi:hypothetical protein
MSEQTMVSLMCRFGLRMFILGWGLLCLGILPAEGARFQAGFAQVDISPPVGWRMSGYFYERFSTSNHDPLQAKVMVWRQGRVKAALVFCDLIGISQEVSSQVRQHASQRTGIALENIMVAATHSHTGPLYFGVLRDHFHEQAVAENGKDSKEWIDYTEILIRRLVDGIARADRSLEDVDISVAIPTQGKLSFNRRFHMKDGTVRFNPGKMNPSIVRTAGPIDPTLPVLAFSKRKENQVLGLFMAFALHLDTVGGTAFSADYPFYLERFLRGYFGQQMISIFGAGPCGDINHIDVSNKKPQKGHKEAMRIGYGLGKTIVDAVPEFEELKRPRLKVTSRTVTVPFQVFDERATKAARRAMKGLSTSDLTFLEKVEVCKILDLDKRGISDVALEVQVFRLNRDVALVGLPGEVFVELGLKIKEQSPFPHTIVVELANDAIAYVPTRKAFKEGSYEVVNSRIQSGGGEALVDTALELLHELD